jgi:putative transposase
MVVCAAVADYLRLMARVLRSGLPDGYFHVVSRAVFGARIYFDDADRRRFLDLLSVCETKHRWRCYAYCLMSTHYHLVVEARRQELSDGMQQLNGRHALGFNRRHRRYGALFAERYSVRVVESDEYLFEACSYVLLNPVKAGLCDSVEDWPWSYSRFEPAEPRSA